MLDVMALTRIIGSFLFVIGLMLVLSWIAKRLKLPEKMLRAQSAKSEGMRVEDILHLDARHRVLTIKRKTTHYVLLLSTNPHTAPILIDTYHEASTNTGSDSDAITSPTL